MVELKGEVVFKAEAYRRAADAIADAPSSVVDGLPTRRAARAAGRRQGHRREARRAGRHGAPALLRAPAPGGAADRCSSCWPVPGPRAADGPRAVRGAGHRDPRRARGGRRPGRMRGVKGLGAKTEERILDALRRPRRRSSRMRLGRGGRAAWARSWARWSARPASAPSSRPARSAGGARPSATSTCWSRPTDGAALIARFTGMPGVEQVLAGGRTQGGRPAARRPAGRPDGHAAGRGRRLPRPLHGIGRAQRAPARHGARPGWSLSEHGFVRLGETACARWRAADRRTFATEAEVYAFLDLPFIDPELREDRGEIEAALAGRLPTLVTLRRPAGRLPHPLRLVGRPLHDRAHGRQRPRGAAACATRC